MRVQTGEAMRQSCSLNQTEASFDRQRALSTSADEDALLTAFPISIETTFLIEFKPFPGV